MAHNWVDQPSDFLDTATKRADLVTWAESWVGAIAALYRLHSAP